MDTQELVKSLQSARHTGDDKLRGLSLVELQQQRAESLNILQELNSVSERDHQGLSTARRFIEDELQNLNRHLRAREDGNAAEMENARRQDRGRNESYETGALLKRDQSVRAYMQDHNLIQQPDFADLRMGQLLRAMVSGPKSDLERRALAEGSDSTGGVSVPDITLARFIDTFRAAQVCIAAGAQTLPLTSDKTTIARTSSDPTAGWRDENGSVDESAPTFEGVVLTPRSLAVIVKASRELIDDSLNIESALEAAFRGSLAVELDRVCLRGSGTPPEPRGIVNTVGINSYPSVPIASYDPFITAMAMNWVDNEPVTSAIIMSPDNFAATALLKEATTNAPLRKPEVLQNVPMMMTNSMDDDTAIVGNFARLIIGIRTSLRIEVLRELYAGNLQYGYLAFLRADVGVEHPASFCKITNLTTS